MNFPCVQCGLCCKIMDRVLLTKTQLPKKWREIVDEFPYDTKADGSCEKLEGNLCTVYDDRPLICNVRKLYEERFADEMSLEEFYATQVNSCNKLMKIHGIPQKERITWPQE